MKLDRMIGILALLLQRERVTAPELAERFEVSVRTILRDMDALCRAGIPIASSQGAGGGFSIMEGYRVDRTLLTRPDLRAILAGLRSLDSVSGTRRYAQLMERLSPGASRLVPGSDRLLIDLAGWHREPLSEKIALLESAIDAGRLAQFRYYAPSGESQREIEPAYIVFEWSSWYVYGWCRTRRDWRLFKLNRIADLHLGGAFVRREAPWPDLAASRVFPERYRVRALVGPGERWRLVEEFGPDCWSEQPDGRLLFEAGFASLGNARDWLLTFADGAEVLAPEELRSEMGRITASMARIYQNVERTVETNPT